MDAYVLDTLMPDLVGHDRQPSAYLVYLFLWRRTDGARADATLSLRAIAEGTGLSKRAVQDALARLAARRLVSTARATITATLTYTLHRPWAARSFREAAGAPSADPRAATVPATTVEGRRM
ncbi:MAG: hypothetical protein JWM27_3761 [Gemmatimonadetes bacterium]|nr:hypothetical protein [Gemmatimonadota bacterium]